MHPDTSRQGSFGEVWTSTVWNTCVCAVLSEDHMLLLTGCTYFRHRAEACWAAQGRRLSMNSGMGRPLAGAGGPTCTLGSSDLDSLR